MSRDEPMRDDGGAAFPVSDQGVHGTYGMSLRDYFAAMAMQGFLAGGAEAVSDVARAKGKASAETLAAASYQVADKMLAARTQDGGDHDA